MAAGLDGSLAPERFSSQGPEEAGWVPIVAREDLDERGAASILAEIAAVDWASVSHAYGPADDVPAQLAAVAVGDAVTRRTAWWNLWGNIHHQGTIYAATVRAVPILVRLAEWVGYPDRAAAILFIREVAEAEGVVVWLYDPDGELLYDDDLQTTLNNQLRPTVRRSAEHLLSSWAAAPSDVRRALIQLLTSFPDLRTDYADLVDQELPADHRVAWESQASGDRTMTEEIDAYERWVYTGE